MKTIDIEGLTSECCQAPIYDGRCIHCGNEAKGEKLTIKGIYMAKNPTIWDNITEGKAAAAGIPLLHKPWHVAIKQSAGAIWGQYWPILTGGLVGAWIGYQLVQVCGK